MPASISPRSETKHDAPEWLEALLLLVERGGATVFARIGIMRAINRGKPNPEVEPRRRRSKRYRVIG